VLPFGLPAPALVRGFPAASPSVHAAASPRLSSGCRRGGPGDET